MAFAEASNRLRKGLLHGTERLYASPFSSGTYSPDDARRTSIAYCAGVSIRPSAVQTGHKARTISNSSEMWVDVDEGKRTEALAV